MLGTFGKSARLIKRAAHLDNCTNLTLTLT